MQTVKNFLIQAFYVAPVLWLFEVLQNKIFALFTGTYGWIYPASSYHWFTFETIPNWGLSVIVIAAMYRYLFDSRQTPFLMRLLIVALTGFTLEWINGYLYNAVTGSPLFFWPGSAMVYIDFIAFPMWIVNALIYHLMAVTLIDLQKKNQG